MLAAYEAVQMPSVAKTQVANRMKVTVNGAVVLDEDEKALQDLWEPMRYPGGQVQRPSYAYTKRVL